MQITKTVTPFVAGGVAGAGITLAGAVLADKKNRAKVKKTLVNLQDKGRKVQQFASHNLEVFRNRNKDLKKPSKIKAATLH